MVWVMLLNKKKSISVRDTTYVMQMLHEWKADMFTLRDLGIICWRQARMPENKTGTSIKIGIWYHQKSAEVIVSRQRAPQSGEVSQMDEGLNVRMVT
jgi:hypothetical protein